VSQREDAFLKTFIGLIGGLVVFTVFIMVLASKVGDSEVQGVSGAAAKEETVEDRIRPVGQVRIAGQVADEEPVAQAPAKERTGKEVVDTACAACHTTGAAGAPKTGDKGQWEARLGQGFDTLVAHALNGFKGMPARGGNPTLTDLEVTRAVAWLVGEVGMKVEVPEPAAAPAAPAATAASAAATQAAPAAGAAAGSGLAADVARGETVYKQACSACHQMGVAGAPRLGDRAAWVPRLQQGLETLNQHALQGIRGMPPKGGRLDMADEWILDAVAFMVQQSS
jgi:cytochrome c5